MLAGVLLLLVWLAPIGAPAPQPAHQESPPWEISPSMVWRLIATVVALAIVLLPRLQLVGLNFGQDDAKWHQADSEGRKTVAQIVAGALLLSGTMLAYLQYVQQRERAELERATAERSFRNQQFVQALTHVSGTAESTRIGGIYALEQIARAWDTDRRTVMEVLAAFVREKAPLTKAPDPASVEAQTAVTVLGRNEWAPVGVRPSRLYRAVIDLSRTNLRGANLNHFQNLYGLREGTYYATKICVSAEDSRVKLVEACLDDASLRLACLENADLRGASLRNAQMLNVRLAGCLMDGADLRGADLSYAELMGVSLRDTDLTDAVLKGARLEGTHLRDVKGLTKLQLSQACVSDSTELPPHLRDAGRVDCPSISR
jgi:hypothetical protein